MRPGIGLSIRSIDEPEPAAMNVQTAAPVLVARTRRRDRRADAQPAGRAQQPVGSAAHGAVGRADRHRRRPQRARRGAGGQRSRLLRRPRPQGIDGAAQRRRRRPRLFPPHHDDLQRHDAADRHSAAAGDRLRARHRYRRRLSTGGELRSRHRLDGGQVRHPRRRYRPVLLDADGGAVAQRAAQTRHAHAAHRRDGGSRKKPPASAWSTARSRRARNAPRRSRWRARWRRNRPTR